MGGDGAMSAILAGAATATVGGSAAASNSRTATLQTLIELPSGGKGGFRKSVGVSQPVGRATRGRGKEAGGALDQRAAAIGATSPLTGVSTKGLVSTLR